MNHQGCALTEERLYEDTGREWPFTSQGDRLQEKPNLSIPWSWTSGLQKCKKRNCSVLATQSVVFFMAALENEYINYTSLLKKEGFPGTQDCQCEIEKSLANWGMLVTYGSSQHMCIVILLKTTWERKMATLREVKEVLLSRTCHSTWHIVIAPDIVKTINIFSNLLFSMHCFKRNKHIISIYPDNHLHYCHFNDEQINLII